MTIPLKSRLGCIQIYTGDGKGKTTAALGLAIRAAGQGLTVGIVYFDKGGTHYGERTILKQLAPRINFWVTGLPRFEPGKPFRFSVTDGDRLEAQKGLDIVGGLFEQPYDLIIMDEINTSVHLGLIPVESVLTLINEKPTHIELVMTGRWCPPELIERADLVSEVKPIKHYFYKGIPAREGIEY